jgi:hypothetical protein
MDFVKVFYSGNPAKVFKLTTQVENTDITSSERALEIHELLAEALGVEPATLFGSISDIQGETYFYTEHHELSLLSTDKFELVFDSDSLDESPTTESEEGEV